MPPAKDWQFESGRVTRTGVIQAPPVDCTCGAAFHLVNGTEQHLHGCDAISVYEDSEADDEAVRDAAAELAAASWNDDQYDYDDYEPDYYRHFEPIAANVDVILDGARERVDSLVGGARIGLTYDECTWAMSMWPDRLTTQERAVLVRILDGEQLDVIGKDLGYSPYLVALHAAYGICALQDSLLQYYIMRDYQLLALKANSIAFRAP